MKDVKIKVKLEDAFQEFLFQKDLEGCKKRTIDDHKTHFYYFLKYLARKKKKLTYVSDVTEEVCKKYIHFMKKEKVKWDDHKTIEKSEMGLEHSTINIRITSLKAQFNFYKTERYIKQSPWGDIKKLKVDQPKIKFLSKEDYSKLLKAPDRSTFVGYRDYVILNILLDNGPRIYVTLNISIEDINLEDGYILYPGEVTKNRRFRVVTMDKRIAFLLKQLLELNKQVNDQAFHIFLSSNGEKLHNSSFRSNLNEYRKRSGIKVSVTPHICRHTFCVWSFNL
ncbi:tyrosine-type recombinase/integrase [Alkalihalobacillus deserti]|uniref:tyrosine-type recombinase/integrase n=1 Tax=Alkalihalobacillus deserti TaxID=2879466 RepID=UPI001D14D477|nr:tyrosine-type recombinase/integrase [Alkalihalobacillus deserti]